MKNLLHTIKVAKGEIKGSILLKNATLVNVLSSEIYKTDVILYESVIAGIGEDYQSAEKIINLNGKFLLPGLLDGHLHIESSLLSPPEFAKLVVLHGTTTVIIDPHEIANVLGIAGIKYMIDAGKNLPIDIFAMISSCVPATHMETSGAALKAADIDQALDFDKVLGLAELMNFTGVISAVPGVLEILKVAQAKGKLIDGHAPGLLGKQLQAYIAAGVGSDHECVTKEEALEKLRSGMRVMIREGSAAKNLAALLPLVIKQNCRRFIFVTDDKHPEDLIEEGHIDHILRKAVSLGLNPIMAIQMATINTAEYFGLKDRGAIAPGYKADIVVVDDLKDFEINMVFKDGQLVVEKGKILVNIPKYKDVSVLKTVKVKGLSKESFRIQVKQGEAKVIGLIPNQIVTQKLFSKPKHENGLVVSDTANDILKLAVIERHHATGNIGLGLVNGFGLQTGALASSVAHDSHNIIVVGTSDEDMLCAAKRVVDMEGGFAIANRGEIVASLALPIAGLMSDAPAEEVCKQLKHLLKVAKELGAKPVNPFITLSFLALPVIPELRLTDKGLVDVNKFEIVSLFG
ncbi:MAG TPA: adenine deaminase [bacterium (Candidatus Stahlbacteria)]|nr:adenine deaminase [Candidatus Stahlbacteria bacterium]